MGEENGFGQLAVAAVGMHEYYTELVKAGFTEDQAIQLLAATINGQKE